MRFVRQLEQEHLLIERVIAAVDTMAATRPEMPLAFVIAAVQFFQTFVDGYHERKEEQGLFPLLRTRAGGDHAATLATLEANHVEGRERLHGLEAGLRDPLGECVGRLLAYGGFLRGHLTRETEVLAPMVDALLRPADGARIARAFASVEAGAARSGGTMGSLADALEFAARAPASFGPPAGSRGLVARDVMRTRTGAVRPDASLQRAHEQMTALSVREVPVVEEGKLVGIVSASDLDPHRGRLEWVPVRTAMTADPVTVAPETPVAEVARCLRERGINGVPVVEGRTVVGMVSRHELLAAIGALP